MRQEVKLSIQNLFARTLLPMLRGLCLCQMRLPTQASRRGRPVSTDTSLAEFESKNAKQRCRLPRNVLKSDDSRKNGGVSVYHFHSCLLRALSKLMRNLPIILQFLNCVVCGQLILNCRMQIWRPKAVGNSFRKTSNMLSERRVRGSCVLRLASVANSLSSRLLFFRNQ